ncbi:hypothetical protein [Natronobacterium texcoconense]|uniref:C2H2-type domain-containing protein n=1 Tax=Natronobacterium texcoconense TaxID=1095778 RepID=A0A1H1H024_NATTX|nr:hypothetical protein [Natronobacterium texcoconense]SDR18713.1 hypothetical protein SAMN04489842_2709 [Natronobacterium texcoconense]
MATRVPIECPICHDVMHKGQQLEQHLYHDHEKRKLAKFVVTETMAMEAHEVSE